MDLEALMLIFTPCEVNVKLSLLIKEFVRINSTFYLIEKNIIFHFI